MAAYGAQAVDVNGLQAQALQAQVLQAQGVADVNGFAQAQALNAQSLQALASVNGLSMQAMDLSSLQAHGFAAQPGGVAHLGVATPLGVGAEALAGQAIQLGQLGMP